MTILDKLAAVHCVGLCTKPLQWHNKCGFVLVDIVSKLSDSVLSAEDGDTHFRLHNSMGNPFLCYCTLFQAVSC